MAWSVRAQFVRKVDLKLIGLYLKLCTQEEDPSQEQGGVMEKEGCQGKVTQAYYWVPHNGACLANIYRAACKLPSLQELKT